MSDSATGPGAEPQLRIGSAERDSAMAALGEHMRAGRLDPHEYDERVEAVGTAKVRGDLERLFEDLPAPHPVFDAHGPALTKATARPSPAPERRPASTFDRVGATAVAASPFVALLLFFLVPGNYWYWFLLIPLTGAIVYGGRHSDDDRRRDA